MEKGRTDSSCVAGAESTFAGDSVCHVLEGEAIEADGDRMNGMREEAEASLQIGNGPFVTDDVEMEGSTGVHYRGLDEMICYSDRFGLKKRIQGEKRVP